MREFSYLDTFFKRPAGWLRCLSAEPCSRHKNREWPTVVTIEFEHFSSP